MKEIKNLPTSKGTQDSDIPTKIIKDNSDIFADFILSSFNTCIANSEFPSSLKIANITPVHKKDSKNLKDNYQPFSILPDISKIYERFMFKQISEYFDSLFSKYQCGFRKGFSSQHCLAAILEKCKSAIENKNSFGALLTDLKKTFDCHPHDLLVAKLNAYGFSMKSLRLIQNYLSNRKQRTKINLTYSSWDGNFIWSTTELNTSSFSFYLFNIFLCDLFFVMNDVEFASYADHAICCKNKY